MTRYMLLAAALLVGVLIGLVLSRLNRARAAHPEAETVYVDKPQPYWYLPWLGGITVLLVGLFLLADPTRAPKDSSYAPAVIKDGMIQPGQFTSTSTAEDDDDK